MKLTQKEKASRFDALQVAIAIERNKADGIAKTPVPDSMQGSLRYFEIGRRKAYEQFRDLLDTWTDEEEVRKWQKVI